MTFHHTEVLIVQLRGSGAVAGCWPPLRTWWDIRSTAGWEARKNGSVKFGFHKGLTLPVLQLWLLKGEKLTKSFNEYAMS